LNGDEMILEIGPGYALSGDGYRFNPKICPSEDVVYLDIEAPRFRCNYNWIVADAHMLPFRSNVFEKIYASHVIEHLDYPDRFLSECYRVLKRGGRLFIYTPNFLSRNAYRDPTHKHYFNFLRLRKMFISAGFKPHFPAVTGSLIPTPIRIILKALFLLTSDEIFVIGEKI